MKVDDKYKYKATVLRVLYTNLTCDDGPLAVVFVEKADKNHKWKLGNVESICQSILKEEFTKI